jgi:hypothetical protein
MHNIKQVVTTVFLLSLFAMLGCGGEPESEQTPLPPKEEVKVSVPKFDRDSAYSFVAKQVAFGPRLPNTKTHLACKNWLVDQFEQYGMQVTEQPFQAKAYTGTVLNGFNIIAQYKPDAAKRILLAAHWDTRHIADSKLSTEKKDQPIPGADDGGSGVAVILEIARQLQASSVDIGVDFVLFDAEDHGDDSSEDSKPETWCLGSQHWSKNIIPSTRPKYAILLDMVGARNTKFPKEGVSMRFAPQTMNKVWALGQELGYGRFFDNEVLQGGVTDDHYFVNTIAQIPMIDIIGMPRPAGTGNSFGRHWHTHDDDLEVIDVRTLKAVGQTMLTMIYREAAGQF